MCSSAMVNWCLRAGPAYRSGGAVVDDSGIFHMRLDEGRGLAGLDTALDFVRRHHGTHGGLVNGLLAPASKPAPPPTRTHHGRGG